MDAKKVDDEALDNAHPMLMGKVAGLLERLLLGGSWRKSFKAVVISIDKYDELRCPDS